MQKLSVFLLPVAGFASVFRKGKTLFPLQFLLTFIFTLFIYKTGAGTGAGTGIKTRAKVKTGTGSRAGFKRGQAMLLDSLVFSMLVLLMLFYTVAFVSGFEGRDLAWQKTVERQRVAFSVSELFLNDPGHPVDWTGFPDRFGLAFYDPLKRQVKESVVFLPEKRVVFLESLDLAMLNGVLDTGRELAVGVESDLVSMCFPREYCAESKGFAEKEDGWGGDCVVVSRIVSVKTESDVSVGVLRVRVCE